MKSFIVLALFVASALAAPQSNPNDANAEIVKFESDNIGVDGYNYQYQTSNGISAQEQGQLVNAGTEDEGIEARGSYSYLGPDGLTYSVSWTAGRAGFVPSGDHIPKP